MTESVKALADEAKEAYTDTKEDIKREVLKKEGTMDDAAISEEEPVRAALETPAAIPPAAPDVTVSQIAQELTEQFNTKYPFMAAGDEVLIKDTQENSYRGQVVTLKPEAIILYTESGRQEIAYSSLHRASRVRCDEAYRSAYLGKVIKKKEAEAAIPAP